MYLITIYLNLAWTGMLNSRATRKERQVRSEIWYAEGLTDVLAKSIMKQYPKWLPDQLHSVEPSLKNDMYPL